MKEPIKVRVEELSDRYIVVRDNDGSNVEDDMVGFSHREFANEWAKENGYLVVE